MFSEFINCPVCNDEIPLKFDSFFETTYCFAECGFKHPQCRYYFVIDTTYKEDSFVREKLFYNDKLAILNKRKFNKEQFKFNIFDIKFNEPIDMRNWKEILSLL